MTNIRLTKIEYYLPENAVANADLQRLNPSWDMAKLADKSGVFIRHFAAKHETAFDLACRACDKLFAADEAIKDSIDGVIFCTQSPDYIMPSNAFLIHKYLELRQQVFAFDLNLACSGFIYCLAIARGLIATGVGNNVLLINADTYSKYVHPKDRSARILFGDGASVCLITRDDTPSTFDVMLASSGKDYASFYIPSGGCRIPRSNETKIETVDLSGNTHTAESIHMNGFGVWKFIASTVPRQVEELLRRNSCSIGDIDLFVFHQASKMTLDSLTKALQLGVEKVFTNIADVGNLVSASIPVALKDAETAGRLRRGDQIVLSGFGVGLSWGTAIMRY